VQTKYIIYFETTAVFQKQPTRYIAEIRAKSGTYLGEFSGVKSEVNLHPGAEPGIEDRGGEIFLLNKCNTDIYQVVSMISSILIERILIVLICSYRSTTPMEKPKISSNREIFAAVIPNLYSILLPKNCLTYFL
jgi:hypothetical protein